ncbi:hypothetical protein NG796_26020 [Laspinema sp. A4]|uniref:hypothetical protein n=1 Tax=Laspinema sp. D2d TaxID=2953686 RepID=UPI0021BBA5FB|nr:hypothetical protein [Laspinema sp. D2d]MCT7986733.1 hypothetical protein [Laspinema sp. D2d]
MRSPPPNCQIRTYPTNPPNTDRRSPWTNCHIQPLSDKSDKPTQRGIASLKLPALTVICDRPQLHFVLLNSSTACKTI